MTTLSPFEIDEKLAALATKIETAKIAFEKLSLAVASGNDAAMRDREDAKKLLDELVGRHGTLSAARSEAARVFTSANRESEARAREGHIAAAIDTAFQLRKLAAAADKMAVEYETLLKEMDAGEASIRISLVRAGLYADIMQHNSFGEHIAENTASMFQSIRGPVFNRQRPMTEVMDVAWRYLPAYAKKFPVGR